MRTCTESHPTILLIHGGFVDGSGWQGVYKRLRKDGYQVIIVQNPTTTLNDDVAFTRRAIDAAAGPVILVGHSYGGVVVTQAGNDPRVVGLVYIAAFAPDNGESVAKLIANPAPGAPVPPILAPEDGFLALDRAKFAASFAADVDPALADFMAASQVPWGVDALNGTVTEAAWKKKPSWYLVAQEDKMIPPPAQRQMAARAKATVAESPRSHSVYISHPDAVVKIVERAASAITQHAGTY
jgi:pimeloyl-ACP methyl ester carboxylesterase